jgi:hypothetical protein
MNRLRTIRRTGYSLALVLGIIHSWSSYPRLILEVFVRKNFGQFYFSLAAVWRTAVILFFMPFALRWVFHDAAYREYGPSVWDTYWGWYMFIAAFLIVSVIRWRETRKMAKDISYPFNHVGMINPNFYKITLFGKPTEKLITCVYEPMFFFLSGYILMAVFGQQIGVLIVINSFFYSVGNYAEYWYHKQWEKEEAFRLQQLELQKKQYQENELRSLINMNRNIMPDSGVTRSDDDIPTAAL